MHMCVFSFTITPYLLCCLCQGRVWLRGAQVLVWGDHALQATSYTLSRESRPGTVGA